VIVPEIVRLANPLLLSSVFTVLVDPLIVTVLVPLVRVEPDPEVSQIPDTVHNPDVTVIVPLDPPVIVTSLTATVEAFAVSIPALPSVNAPPVRPRLAVESVVVDDVSETVRVPLQRKSRVAIVNVIGEAEEDWNLTLLNSLSLRVAPPKVIVCATELAKSTSPVPVSHTALSVDALVQRPVIVHVSDPNVIAEAADEMFTPPVMLPAPDVLVVSPPDIVSPSVAPWLLLIIRVRVFFASVPPEMVSVRSTTKFDPSVLVPADTVAVVSVLSVESIVVVPVPSNVYVLVVPSPKVEPEPEVSQLLVMVHAPVVTVIVPLVPPSMVTFERTTVEAFAVRIPALPTLRSGVSAALPMASPAVASSVVDDASVTARVESHLSPRVDIVKTTADAALLLNVTLLNSGAEIFAPAKVMVTDEALLNVTVFVPASQDAEVVAFVQLPLNSQLPEPKSKNEPVAEMFTLPVTVPVEVLVPQLMLPPDSVRAPVIEIALPPLEQLNGRLLVAWASDPPFVQPILALRVKELDASSNPLSVKLAMLAAASTVIVQAAVHDVASMVTALLLVGARHPPDPLAALDQYRASLQLPVPLDANGIQNLEVPQGRMPIVVATHSVEPDTVAVPGFSGEPATARLDIAWPSP